MLAFVIWEGLSLQGGETISMRTQSHEASLGVLATLQLHHPPPGSHNAIQFYLKHFPLLNYSSEGRPCSYRKGSPCLKKVGVSGPRGALVVARSAQRDPDPTSGNL